MDRERGGLVGHVAQSEADGHAIEGVVARRAAARHRRRGIDVAGEARVEQPVAADLEHGRLMSDRTTRPVLPDLTQHPHGEIAGAAGDVERALPGLKAGERQREVLPQPMHAERHQVVHDVVLAGHRAEHRAHPLGLFAPRRPSRSRNRPCGPHCSWRPSLVGRIVAESRRAEAARSQAAAARLLCA